MKKKIAVVFLVLALVLVACNGGGGTAGTAPPTPTPPDGADAPAGDPSDDPHVTLVYAEVNPPDTVVGQIGIAFQQQVEYLSGGSITINFQGSGVLGAEEAVLDTMLGGGDTIHIARISAFALNPYGLEMSRLLSTPFTFQSREHFWTWATSPLAQEFLNEPLELGLPLRGLFYGEEGFRHIFTTEHVAGLEDLAGMQIRVPGDPILMGMVSSFGADPVNIPFTELYSALQTGVVDGAEQPITNYEANAFPEVAPYLLLNSHTLGVIQIVILEPVWQSLTPNQQNAIMGAIEYIQGFNAELAAAEEAASLERMAAAGVTITEVPDLAPWAAAAAEVIESNTNHLPDVYQQILDMA